MYIILDKRYSGLDLLRQHLTALIKNTASRTILHTVECVERELTKEGHIIQGEDDVGTCYIPHLYDMNGVLAAIL